MYSTELGTEVHMVKFMICKVETRNVRTFHFRCGFLEGMWYMYTVNLQYTSRIFYLDQTYVYTYVFACIFCIPEENYRRIPSIYVLGRIKFLKHSDSSYTTIPEYYIFLFFCKLLQTPRKEPIHLGGNNNLDLSGQKMKSHLL